MIRSDDDDGNFLGTLGYTSLARDHFVMLFRGFGCPRASEDRRETTSAPVDDIVDDDRWAVFNNACTKESSSLSVLPLESVAVYKSCHRAKLYLVLE